MMRASLVALALVAGLCSVARAQVEPKIYILFDTSGSMLADTGDNYQPGDGSPLCTNLGQASRIYQLKVALFDALQGMGDSEVDFALATFPMFVDANRTPLCAVGTLAPCTTSAECNAVRPGETCEWITLRIPFNVPCSDNTPCNGYSCGNSGVCNFTCHPVQRPCATGWSCATGGECVRQACWSSCGNSPSCSGHYFTGAPLISELDPDPSDPSTFGCKVSTHNPLVAAQQSASCGDASNPCAPWYAQYKSEVLKVGFGRPPEEVMYYFDQKEDHPLASNPEVRVGNGWLTPLGKSLFYAHGYFHKEVALPAGDYRKKCERLVVAMFTDGNETCNDASTSDPYYPTTWAANLRNNPLLKVTTHTVAIDVTSGLLQQIATAGGGMYVPVSGSTAALKKAFLDIIAQSRPPAETCNGEDDDCDNAVDEDFPLKGTPCDNGKLSGCNRTGVYVCAGDGNGVVCNAPDAQPAEEICNGIDDDCDGEIDEIPGCVPCVPQPEICNGLDDDCDALVDEEIPSVPCGKEVGECKPGMTSCENGKAICAGGNVGTDEVCDGLDNDCDGQRDGIVELCYTFPAGCDLATATCKGICKLGTKECTASEAPPGTWSGAWSECQGQIGPETELCDGLDNDCDGEVDEEAECPGGAQCINGQCSSPCMGGEFVCPAGQLCKDGWCILDSCDRAACSAKGHICKAGVCVDPCAGVTCGKFQKCELGSCVDDSCYQARPCPAGENCIQGVCQKDPCSGVTCAAGTYCQGGRCITLCDEMDCGAGQVCKLVDDGGSKVTRCVADPCAGTVCRASQICVDGKCVIDPCEALACAGGEVCIDGTCQPDPCEHAVCPSGYRCDKGLCLSRAQGVTRVLATGAGGCACSAGSTPDGSLLGLGLLLALAWGRRRRGTR